MRELHKCIACSRYTLYPDKELSKESENRLKEVNILLEESNKEREAWVHKLKERPMNLTEEETDKELLHMRLFKEWGDLRKEAIKKLESQVSCKCNYCGEKLLPDILHEEGVISLGYKLYEEYIAYMGFDRNQMPEDIIIRVGEFGDPNGRCGYDKEVKKFVITIRRGEDFYIHNLIPIFYHEFTHIYDLYDPTTKERKKEEDCLHWFTEYNASEVEIKKLLGFKSINHDKKFRLSTKVIWRGKTQTIRDYLNREVKGYTQMISKFLKDGLTLESITSILTYFMYCRSKLNFCKKHLGKDSIDLIPNVNGMEKYLENLLDNDVELTQHLNDLDDCIADSTDNINSQLLDDIIQRIKMQLISHIPQHAHLRNMDTFIKYLNEEKKKNEGAI